MTTYTHTAEADIAADVLFDAAEGDEVRQGLEHTVAALTQAVAADDQSASQGEPS